MNMIITIDRIKHVYIKFQKCTQKLNKVIRQCFQTFSVVFIGFFKARMQDMLTT